jgi:ribosome-associated protein
MTKSTFKTLDKIAQTIYDKKGFNILALDVREISTMTDFCVIAEGNIARHVDGISAAIEDSLAKSGEELLRKDKGYSDWVVMDYGDIIIHIFVPDSRETYALEQLWREAKIVDLHIDVKGLEGK